jgi:hypothetical protein
VTGLPETLPDLEGRFLVMRALPQTESGCSSGVDLKPHERTGQLSGAGSRSTPLSLAGNGPDRGNNG